MEKLQQLVAVPPDWNHRILKIEYLHNPVVLPLVPRLTNQNKVYLQPIVDPSIHLLNPSWFKKGTNVSHYNLLIKIILIIIIIIKLFFHFVIDFVFIGFFILKFIFK